MAQVHAFTQPSSSDRLFLNQEQQILALIYMPKFQSIVMSRDRGDSNVQFQDQLSPVLWNTAFKLIQYFPISSLKQAVNFPPNQTRRLISMNRDMLWINGKIRSHLSRHFEVLPRLMSAAKGQWLSKRWWLVSSLGLSGSQFYSILFGALRGFRRFDIDIACKSFIHSLSVCLSVYLAAAGRLVKKNKISSA